MRTPRYVPALVLLAATALACGGNERPDDQPTALHVVSVSPADGATGFALDGVITLTGDAPLDAASFATALTLVPATEGSVSVDGAVATFRPAAPLAGGTTYTVKLSADAKSKAGLALAAPFSSKFTTVEIPDTVAPSGTDLGHGVITATSVELKWTAPGDDGFTGTAASQSLRYATGDGCPLTAANFAAATEVTTLGAPKAGGTAVSFVVTGLAADTSYCFALQVTDDAGHATLTDSFTYATADLVAPGKPVLTLSQIETTSLAFGWVGVHENGDVGGAVTAEELRRNHDDGCTGWSAATFEDGEKLLLGEPTPPGSESHFGDLGLSSDHTYCYLLKVSDESGNSTFSDLFQQTLPDDVPPAPITDLAAKDILGTTVTLGWTATGDSADFGTAASATLHYAPGACPAALPLENELTTALPAPSAAGTAESFAVRNLDPKARYCFALVVADDMALESTSNLVEAVTGPLDPFAPGAPTDLEAAAVDATHVRLRFTAPADNAGDASSGPVSSFELRFLTGDACTIDAASFASGTATDAAAGIVSAAPGSPVELMVDALAQETTYCFGLVALDETPNASPVAAFPRVRTPDGTAPAAPALVGGATRTDTTLEVAWTAVGDDLLSGTAATQQLYRLTGACPALPPADPASWTTVTTPAPVQAGLPQSALVSGLANGTDYCFFLRVADEAGNTTDSNLFAASTQDVVAPGKPTLQASFTNGDVKLDWTATGDDGTTGAAAKYQLFQAVATGACPADLASTTTPVREIARADAAGTPETLLLHHAPAFSKVCYALRAVDDAGNVSDASNVVSVDTQETDILAPGSIALTIAAATSGGATIAFTAPANDGTDASTGAATAYELRYTTAAAAADCAKLTDASFGTATAVSLPAPGAPGSAERFTVGLGPADSGWCLAIRARDAVPNRGALSNWAYARDNTAPAAPALTASAFTATSVTVTFAAPGDDGTTGTAAAYVLAYRTGPCPSAAAAFDFTGAPTVAGLAAPKASGASETITASGLTRGAKYCLALKSSDEVGNSSVALLEAQLPTPDTSAQIAAVRAAIHSATASPVTLGGMAVQSAIVSYVKPAFGGFAAGTLDGPGFFVQNGGTGPALFLALDPAANGNLQKGDVVDLAVQTAIWGCTFTPCDADNSMAVVTAATVTKLDSGATLPVAQELTTVTLPLPIGTGPWAYEHERVTMSGVVGAFASAGTGFVKASFTTAGTPGANLALRVPDTFPAALGIGPGCTVAVTATPMWRNGTEAQVAAWAQAELAVSKCPPTVLATNPADGSWLQNPSVVTVTFSAAMDPASLTVQSSAGTCTGALQLATDATFTSCVGLTVAVSGATATLTPVPALTAGQRYRLRVTSPAAGTDGAAIPSGVKIDQAVGFATSSDAVACTAPSVVISQVYGGGGNSGSTYKNDFIELHNRGTTVANLAGWSVQYGSSGGTTWSVTPLSGSIPPGGYYLVQEAAGTAGTASLPSPDVATGTINMSATAGKVAVVTNTTALSGACPTSAAIVDLIGFGGANCSKGTPSLAPGNLTSITRVGNACVDHGANYADFLPGTPTPRSTQSPTVGCGCTGVTNAVLNGSGTTAEADLCSLVGPTAVTVAAGQTSAGIAGRLTEAGITPTTSGNASVRAELGLGPAGSNPFFGWTYFPATFNASCTGCGSADEYTRTLAAPGLAGSYSYAWRFSTDAGQHWTYCDADGAGSTPGASFERTKLGTMTVTP